MDTLPRNRWTLSPATRSPAAPPETTDCVPDELRTDAILALFDEHTRPVEGLLDLLIKCTGAAWALIVKPAATHSCSLDIVARGRNSKPIPAADRLVQSDLLEPFFRGLPVLLENDCNGSSWRAGVAVGVHSRHLAARRERKTGALLLGGPRRTVAEVVRKNAADLTQILTFVAPWAGAALLLQDRGQSHDELPPDDGDLPKPSLLEPYDADFPEIVTVSTRLRRVLETVRRVASSDAAVLIEGESGTGKELIARAIHRKSNRRRSFLSENCAACPTHLLEAEFFGVEKGAFTGAVASKAGIFERVNGGTLFLDEIAEMDISLQTKLLRVLQEREVRRVGGDRCIPVDFRLISATNRRLDRSVRENRFRLDLLFRLDVVKITLPALRERPDDIPYLAHQFLKTHAERLRRPVPALRRQTLHALTQYRWPGNVRELQNEMWRAVALGHTVVWPVHLSPRIQESSSGHIADNPEPVDFEAMESDILGTVLRAALHHCDWNRTQTARLLGLPRTTLYRKMRKYGVDSTRCAQPPGNVGEALTKYQHLDRLLREKQARAEGE